MTQKCNAEGLRIIQSCESLELEAYPDPASPLGRLCSQHGHPMRDYRKVPGWEAVCGKPWTVGFGDTGGVCQGQQITEADAEARLARKVSGFEAAVSRALKRPVTENQFSALVCFAYNVIGWADSTLIKKINAGDVQGAADEFPKWDHAGGKVLAGLTKRRALERELFLKA